MHIIQLLLISFVVSCGSVQQNIDMSCDNGVKTKNITTHTFALTCIKKDLNCSSLFCIVSVKGEKNSSYDMTGSWYYDDKNQRVFQLKISDKAPIMLNQTQQNITIGKIIISGQAKFSELKSNYTQILEWNLTLSYKLNEVVMPFQGEKINAKLYNLRFPYNCANIPKCWARSPTCSQYYCEGSLNIQQTNITYKKINFTFYGSASWNNTNYPDYFQEIKFGHSKSQNHTFYYNKSKQEHNLFFQPTGNISVDLSMKVTFDSSGNPSSNLRLAIKKDNLPTINKTFGITFTKCNCLLSISSSTSSIPASSISTSDISASSISTSDISTSDISTLSIPASSSSAITSSYSFNTLSKISPEVSTIISSSTISPTVICVPTSKNDTCKGHKSKHSADPAKIVLIVLAVLIVASVIVVAVYLKKRKRLSNQPAYYNDIALNDPLRYEIDNEEEQDDDELPLFA